MSAKHEDLSIILTTPLFCQKRVYKRFSKTDALTQSFKQGGSDGHVRSKCRGCHRG